MLGIEVGEVERGRILLELIVYLVEWVVFHSQRTLV